MDWHCKNIYEEASVANVNREKIKNIKKIH